MIRSADLATLCGRDHKWQHMAEAVERMVCDCALQFRQVHELYRLWNCTHQLPVNPYPPITADRYVAPPVRVCNYAPDRSTGLTARWKRDVKWEPSFNDYRLLGEPVQFPIPADETKYFKFCSLESRRNCTVDLTWNHTGRGCLQFCSWHEAITYVNVNVCDCQPPAVVVVCSLSCVDCVAV